MSTEANPVVETSLAIPTGAEVSLVGVKAWLSSPDVQTQITQMQIEAADAEAEALQLVCVTEPEKGKYELDHDRYAAISNQLSIVKGRMKKTEAGFALALDPLNSIIGWVRAAKNSIMGRFVTIENHYKSQILTYERVNRAQNEERERIARQQQQDKEDAERIASAEKLVDAGIAPAQAAKVLDAPRTQPLQTFGTHGGGGYRPAPKTAGQFIKEKWQFQFDEIPADDPVALKRAFVKLAAADDRLLAYFDFATSALNRDCVTQKSMMKIQNVGRAVDVGSVSSRAR